MSAPAEVLRSALLRRVAWGSVVLGLAVQAAVLLAAATVDAWPGAAGALVATLSFVSWSVVVCTGLAAAYAASEARPGATALAGLALAPLGLLVARGMQAGLAQALDAEAAPGLSPFVVAAARAVEYALLGAALALLARRPSAGAAAHVGAGLVLGLLTGAVLAFVASDGLPEALPGVLNEALFPAGCALLLFLARGSRAPAVPAAVPAG